MGWRQGLPFLVRFAWNPQRLMGDAYGNIPLNGSM